MPALPLEPRHRPSGLNDAFNGGQASFAGYVAATRDMLLEAHAKLGAAGPDKIVDGNAPFELQPPAGFPAGRSKPYRRGVLLTHGLLGSPYVMRHLADFFQQNGFRVMAVLLPGHGTQPGDLLDVRWQEWAKAVAYGVDRLSEEADEIYLAGYSTGGALSVHQSLDDARVRGLFLFSPAFRISSRAAWANWHRLYSWLIPSGKWLTIKPDRDIYKYESVTKHAAAQTYALTRELDARLRQHGIGIPVFAAASVEDATVDTAATLEFIARTQHPSSKLVLYTPAPGESPPGIPPERIELVDSIMPEQRILGFSHTSIVLSAEDMHYGAAGEYCNCLHYYPHDLEKYAACLQHPDQDWQGEVTAKNLAAGTLRRLMFNPKFAQLETSMQRFIDKL